jgi:hypothetical protein
VVLQKTGYDGDPKKLAETIRAAASALTCAAYVRQQPGDRSLGRGRGDGGEAGIGQNVVGYDACRSCAAEERTDAVLPFAREFPLSIFRRDRRRLRNRPSIRWGCSW